jgi:hypothetical protein
MSKLKKKSKERIILSFPRLLSTALLFVLALDKTFSDYVHTKMGEYIMINVFLNTNSDYPFVISKLFLHALSNNT